MDKESVETKANQNLYRLGFWFNPKIAQQKKPTKRTGMNVTLLPIRQTIKKKMTGIKHFVSNSL